MACTSITHVFALNSQFIYCSLTLLMIITQCVRNPFLVTGKSLKRVTPPNSHGSGPICPHLMSFEWRTWWWSVRGNTVLLCLHRVQGHFLSTRRARPQMLHVSFQSSLCSLLPLCDRRTRMDGIFIIK